LNQLSNWLMNLVYFNMKVKKLKYFSCFIKTIMRLSFFSVQEFACGLRMCGIQVRAHPHIPGISHATRLVQQCSLDAAWRGRGPVVGAWGREVHNLRHPFLSRVSLGSEASVCKYRLTPLFHNFLTLEYQNWWYR